MSNLPGSQRTGGSWRWMRAAVPLLIPITAACQGGDSSAPAQTEVKAALVEKTVEKADEKPSAAAPAAAKPAAPSAKLPKFVTEKDLAHQEAHAANAAKPATGKVSGKGAPKLTFTKMTHDFGLIPQGQKRTTKFAFKNEGDGTLEVIRTQGS